MPFTDPTDTVQAVLTDQGRDLMARSLLGQVSIQLQGFRAGRAGYQDLNPVLVDPVDPSDTALQDPVWPVPVTGLAPFVSIERPVNNVVSAVCRIDRADCTWGLGELGVWARVLRNETVAQYQYTTGAGGILFTSRVAGTTGNSTTVEFVVAGTNTPLTIDVTGQSITVNVATNGGGSPVSTVLQVLQAIEVYGPAAAWVGCQVTGDQTAVASALGVTNLTGGGVVNPTYQQGQDYLVALAHFPLLAKTDRHVLVFRLVIAL
jgi:hypothetical protein